MVVRQYFLAGPPSATSETNHIATDILNEMRHSRGLSPYRLKHLRLGLQQKVELGQRIFDQMVSRFPVQRIENHGVAARAKWEPVVAYCRHQRFVAHQDYPRPALVRDATQLI